MKVRSIKLTDGWAPTEPVPMNEIEWQLAQRFRVEALTDSIEFRIGQFLERVKVEELCRNDMWRVTVVARKE